MRHLKLILTLTLTSSLGFAVACGDKDDDGDSSDSANDGGSVGDDAPADDGGDAPADDGAMSECSSNADCDIVVCECPDGPVNFTYCGIVNDIGVCGTAETCVELGACE